MTEAPHNLDFKLPALDELLMTSSSEPDVPMTGSISQIDGHLTPMSLDLDLSAAEDTLLPPQLKFPLETLKSPSDISPLDHIPSELRDAILEPLPLDPNKTDRTCMTSPPSFMGPSIPTTIPVTDPLHDPSLSNQLTPSPSLESLMTLTDNVATPSDPGPWNDVPSVKLSTSNDSRPANESEIVPSTTLPLPVSVSGSTTFAPLYQNPDERMVPEPLTVNAIPWTTVIQDPVGKRIDIVPGDAVLEDEQVSAVIVSPIKENKPLPAEPESESLPPLSQETIDSLSSAMEAFQGPSDTTVFGFGGFQTVFISEEEIEATRKKLGEQASVSQEDRIEQLLEKIVTNAGGLPESEDNLGSTVASILCCQWTQLGHGQLWLESNQSRLIWKGVSITNSPLSLSFDITQCSDIRTKAVEDASSAFLMTYQDSLFVQFLAQDNQAMSGLEASILKHKETTPEKAKLQETTSLLPKPSLEDLAKDPEYIIFKTQAEAELQIETQKIREEMEARIAQVQATFETKLNTYLETRQNESKDTLQNSNSTPDSLSPTECQICFNGMTSILLLPCKHALCEPCNEQIQALCDNKCPFDRLSISESVSLSQ